jgi:hypothetical protein
LGQRARVRLAELVFNSRVASRLWRRAHVLCLGDSHVRVFNDVRMADVWFRVVSVKGATASGIQNPHSATNARVHFQNALRAARPWQHVLVNLGEVDCNFIIWRQAERTGASIESVLADTLDSYEGFLREVAAHAPASVCVLSATLPTIEDYQRLKELYPEYDPEILGLRSQIRVPCADRIQLTRTFNAGLAQRCAAMGIRFIDTTTEQLDPATGRVRTDLMVDGMPSIHLDSGRYAALIVRMLRELGYPNVRP